MFVLFLFLRKISDYLQNCLLLYKILRRMMSERDYAPLSAACVRSLNDKLYEKRKPAAVEIEK